MKTTNKFVTLTVAMAVAASGFIATAAPAQATEFDVTGLTFDFKNGTEDIGTNAVVGFSHRYTNVVTVGSQEIDAIITVVSVDGLDSDDNSSNGPDNEIDYLDGWDEDSSQDAGINPQIDVMNAESPYGDTTFRLEFVLSGTSTPATLTNVSLYVADIDEYQFAEFSGPQSYELSTETSLRVKTHSNDSSIPNGTYRFYDWDYTDSESDDEENWASVSYDAFSSIDITVGSFDQGSAYFRILFQEAPFEGDTDVTTPEPTAYTITYDGNGKSAGSVPNNTVGTGSLTIANNSGNLVRTGYVFAGWNTKADGTGLTVSPGSSYRPTLDLTLYAQWEEVRLSPVKLTKVIYFNSASGKITPAALRQLRAFVNSVKGIDVVTNISIYGYVQPTANNNADKVLSAARAKNTASVLKKLGIGKINDAVGMGKAINKSAAGSRYVRIVVRGFNDVTPR
ncbi:MAG: hypothetical protein RLZZ426_581 [Actinomycetota bacterium]